MSSRRSAIRVALAGLVSGVTVASQHHRDDRSTLIHLKVPSDKILEGANPHLLFFVEPQETRPSDSRGAVGTKARTQYAVQVFYAGRHGVADDGIWTDIDAANDLAEDIVTALLDDGDQEYGALLASLSVRGPNARNHFQIDIRIDVHHEFAA